MGESGHLTEVQIHSNPSINYRNSTRPCGLVIVAMSAGLEPAYTRRSNPSRFSISWTGLGPGCSARRSASLEPCAADCAGWGVCPQSMKNGTIPLAKTVKGSVKRHDSTTPSSRFRLPEATAPSFTPCRAASLTNWSKSFPWLPSARASALRVRRSRTNEASRAWVVPDQAPRFRGR